MEALKNLIKRAIQTLKPIDTGIRQFVQVSFLGQTKDVKAVSPYGVFSSAPIGSDWIILSARGNRDDLYGIGNDYKNRIKNLKEYEVALMNTKTKALIFLKDDGSIFVKSEKSVDVESPMANFSGDVTITGNLNVGIDAIINNISFVNHTHGGVLTGGSNTDAPNP